MMKLHYMITFFIKGSISFRLNILNRPKYYVDRFMNLALKGWILQ